ncbi:MAG: phosphatase PAP2 family protein [Ignavibacteriae bacterium]|nr:phosphatase PAP2 family protein [Ignavibacteriota bacterium]
MKTSIAILLCISFFQCKAAETDSSHKSVLEIIGNDLSAAGENAEYIYREIGGLSLRSATIVAGIGVGTYLVSTQDESLRSKVIIGHTGASDKFCNTVREYGGTYSIVGVAGTLYIGGLIIGSDEVRTTGRLVAEGLIVSGLTNTFLKFTFGRARPYQNRGNSDFQWFEPGNDFASLPSGHTNAAFTISTVLSDRINRWWATIPLYGLAVATGYSRMYHDMHWASDVFLGAAIGYLSGKAITAAEEERQNPSKTQTMGLRLYPTIGGIGLNYKF